jgi:glyceraldehyde 3-phosphate dehydrogenase
MPIRVAINGYGRIGRATLRALYESGCTAEIKIIAINDPHPLETSVHLTQFDSTHGHFGYAVTIQDEQMWVGDDAIHYSQESDPARLPWATLKIDLVLECSGRFTLRSDAAKHLQAGAKKVIISAPAEGEIDLTTVFGINDNLLKAEQTVISNASCTTNCLAHIIKPLNESIGIEQGLISTVHAYTNDQVLIDSHHDDLRRARSATQSIIPTRTGATRALERVMPEITGKFDGISLRVPTLNVSLVDLSFTAARNTSAEEINEIMLKAADGKLLCYSKIPLVSIDYNHTAASANFDSTLTKVKGNLVRIYAWYDNEWGYANRLLDTTQAFINAH